MKEESDTDKKIKSLDELFSWRLNFPFSRVEKILTEISTEKDPKVSDYFHNLCRRYGVKFRNGEYCFPAQSG